MSPLERKQSLPRNVSGLFPAYPPTTQTQTTVPHRGGRTATYRCHGEGTKCRTRINLEQGGEKAKGTVKEGTTAKNIAQLLAERSTDATVIISQSISKHPAPAHDNENRSANIY